jgi:pimeloyl-ACP methyl ester carboxylesterase
MQKHRAFVATVMLVLGSLLAWYVQSGTGTVKVSTVRFAGGSGNMLSALLYVPEGVTDDRPAPAIVAIHGYINSKETQSGFAIEFARRGFVVLAPDETGHGFSDPPAFADGFGGPAALAYLRSLPFVDKSRIGLEGHSMGGWAVQMAAASQPDGYAAMVLEGSSTGTLGVPRGTPEVPRNLLLVYSRFDEFSSFMWGSAVPAGIVKTQKLKTLFGSTDDVVPGRLYGDIASGTARKLLMPAVTHPGDHLSREAIGAAIAWFQLTLKQQSDLRPQQQIWYWKEFGTMIALVGLMVLMFPMIDWLLALPWFKGVRRPLPEPVRIGRLRLGINAALMCLVPVLTFFPLQAVANKVLPANALLPQQITNGVLLWAWGNGAIMLLMFSVWYRSMKPKSSRLGVSWETGLLLRSAGIAIVCCGLLYLILLLAGALLEIDFRFWVVALKTMSRTQDIMFLVYLIPFTAFFVILALSLHTQLGRRTTLALDMCSNSLLLSIGFVIMLLIQYLPFLLGGTLTVASQPLLSIVAFQFVPLMFLVGMVSTFCYARTGTIYTGAFINGILVTWYIVAGTATEAAPFWY